MKINIQIGVVLTKGTLGFMGPNVFVEIFRQKVNEDGPWNCQSNRSLLTETRSKKQTKTYHIYIPK